MVHNPEKYPELNNLPRKILNHLVEDYINVCVKELYKRIKHAQSV
jgi:hypothetical protein